MYKVAKDAIYVFLVVYHQYRNYYSPYSNKILLPLQRCDHL